MGLATPKQVADALRDTKIYEISGNARRSGGLANNADIADLGAAIGKHVEPGARGAVSVDPAISDALWTLPADLRGVLIERALGSSVYKDWFNVGALDHGFFPQVDFASRPSGALQADLVSVKSINPMTKAFHGSTPYTLSEHVTDIVTASHNAARATGTYRTVTVDIRIPPGNAVAGRELQKTLRWFVPPDLAKYVRVVVHEF